MRPPGVLAAGRNASAIRRRSLAILSAAVLSVHVSSAADAQVIREDLYVTGAVRAMARSGNTLYIGGSLVAVGPSTGCAVPIDAASGAPVSGFPKIAGTVSAVAADGNGGWYIGGYFKAVGGTPRSNLAHVLANNTLANWDPSPDGVVTTLAVAVGTVFVGGQFASIGGQARNGLAALDATTGLSTAWDPNPDASNIAVLALSGATLYAAGGFTTIGGQSRNGLAALDATTGLATSWDPNPDGSVSALALTGGTIYAGGYFTNISGQSKYFIAALDSASGVPSDWSPGFGGPVSALAASEQSVYVGGDVSLAAFDATTGLVAWGVAGSATALVVSGTTLYVAAYGDVAAYGGSGLEVRAWLAAVDVVTGELTDWDPRPNSAVRALAVDGTRVLAGGEFTSVGGVVRHSLAALDLVTGLATDWNPDLEGSVAALAVSGSMLYAGGSFRFAYPVPNDTAAVRYNLTAFDLASGEPTGWNPNANANGFQLAHQRIATLTASGSTMYVGGRFNQLGGQIRNYLAALDGVSGEATDWNPSPNDSVTVIAVRDNTVYVGGTFDSIGGQPRNGLAALSAAAHDSTDSITTAWDPNPWPPSAPDPNGDPSTGLHFSRGPIHTIAASGNTVYVGGPLGGMGGCPCQNGVMRHYLAALDATTGVATAWDAGILYPFEGFPFLDVSTIVATGDAVYVGGSFGTIGGQQRGNLAALDVSTGASTEWNPGADGGVGAILVDGLTVYAGGTFRSIGGLPQSGIAAMGDLSTPTLVSLMSADAVPGHVHLAWYSAEGRAVTATVYRRTSNSDWNAVARITGDGTGRLVFEDTEVSAATRYGYRLGFMRDGIEEFLGETWVEVPPALAFALGGARPNPAEGDVRAAFSLPDASPARLELVDIAGRRIAARDVGALGPGNHVVALAEGRTLPGGIYLMRLTRGGQSLSARVIVLR